MFCLNSFFFFFFFFFLSFFLNIYFFEYDIIFFFEWVIFSLNGIDLTCIFLFDWISMIFMSFVFLISGSVLYYSLGYMKGDLNLIRFFYLVFMFIMSMIMFIMMPDLICLLLGWDGLGLVSYCLIIYYNNMISLSSGLLTVFINRLGDVFLIVSIGWFFNFGSWHFFLYNDFFDMDLVIMVYLILFASFTSSAQFPFSFWLPAAMAAPTPVSSLVHSSTLVTSGIYLMIRFNYYIFFFDTSFLMFVSVITMFISGFGACMENDLKSVIAYSTLSQLGFMFFVLSFGSLILCFVHLLIHAIFKCMLFLCTGFFIHCFMGNQDIRFMGGLLVQSPYISSCFCISLLCLCGFPFFSGFYSSDFIVELIILSEINYLYFFFFCLSIFLTLVYSFRLMYYLFFFNSFFFSMINFIYCFYMNISLFFLFFFSLVGGSLIFWIFIDFVFVIDLFMKLIPLYIFFFFFFMIYNIMDSVILFCLSFYFYFFGSMVFLNYFSSSFFLKKFFCFGLFVSDLVDFGWLEYKVSGGLVGFLSWLMFYLENFVLRSFYIYLVSFILFFFLFFFF
uniref:NADH dehydrogenase subunit 5 n=1 Tax=Klapperibrachys cremeri TaxID=3081117 RepID=UPI002A82BE5F|nr:NADH dehydrogenase subunit 5 [Klapperibrachys cremeri]WOW99081.1 NADH dehydrogenase subunit 5 [Klapperibrachys cremeri]